MVGVGIPRGLGVEDVGKDGNVLGVGDANCGVSETHLQLPTILGLVDWFTEKLTAVGGEEADEAAPRPSLGGLL